MHDAEVSLSAMKRAPVKGAPARKSTLICFSHLRWNFVFQRPQHLLTRAARDYRVIFFEEPVHAETAEPRLDARHEPGGVLVVNPVLPHGVEPVAAEAMQRRLLDQLLTDVAERPWLFWYYTPMALAFSAHLRPEVCVYDCMDELSAFRFAPPRLLDRERELLARADLVFTGGQSLYEAKRGRHRSVHAFPSSIDASHFRKARAGASSEPADQAGLPRPRLGYFGVIDERMDLSLLAAMAEGRPDWHFVMIGPVVKIAESELPRRPNIHWLGGKTYDELPSYLAGWDVGLMPFALNESTRFISPTKTPEFLAAGVPVVSTAVTDVVRSYGQSGLVEIAADASDAVAKADMLMGRPKDPWLRHVDRALSSTSWDMTWAEMNALIVKELDRMSPTRTVQPAMAKAAAHV